MTSVKIALVGTSCVGKTTILEELKSVFPNHVFINEVAREYFLKNKSENRFSFQDQKNIQDEVIRREKELKEKFITCDRSVICPIIYTLAAGDVGGGEILFDRIKDWIGTYTHLILLDPSDVPYKNDMVRDENSDFRMMVHEEYIRFLEDKDIQYTLLSGVLKKRIERVQEIINRYE